MVQLSSIVFVIFAYQVAARGLPAIPQRGNIKYDRIVGGEETSIQRVPYQIALLYESSLFCGGSIIKPNVAVTAAYCTDFSFPSMFSIRAGSTQHSSGGQVILVAEIYQHELYHEWDGDFDISILELTSSLIMGTQVTVISLPTSDFNIADGTLAIVSGWGRVDEEGDAPENLRQVSVPIINKDVCARIYGEIGIEVTERMICAGNIETGGKGACDGDLGGPMAIDGKLIGITSWGVGCARPKYPGVWTNVPVLVSWIQETIANIDQ